MKSGNWIIRTVMWVLMATIAAYFGFYAFHVAFDTFATDTLYTYAAEDLTETSGYVVREEQVLSGGSELTAVTVAEGEKVSAGETVALVYDDQKALERHQQMEALEERLTSLQYIFSHSIVGSDSDTLNENIVSSIVSMKKTVSDGDLNQLPDLSSQLKMLLFRHDYTYNGSAALTEEMNDLDKQIRKLAEKNRSSTSAITAPQSGTFSGMVDGYESILTPDSVRVLTPERLEELVSSPTDIQEKLDSGEYLGKLVTNDRWYYITVMQTEEAAQLQLGKTVSTRFDIMGRTLDMRVDSVSSPDEHKSVCVLLSSDRFMSEATLLRDQTADLIFDTVTGFRVVKSAIHVDNQTGEIGVYRVFGSRLKWIPVEILLEGEDYYLIRQAVQFDEDGNQVPLTSLQEASRLRVGAEIAVKGHGLYDGKVIE